MARRRGLEVVHGRAECLPITVLCFLDDPVRAFREIARILVPGGVLVVGFLDCEGPIVEVYLRDGGVRRFLSRAHFYSSGEVQMLLETGGFRAVTVRSRAGFGIIAARKDESVLNEKRNPRHFE